MKLAATLDEAGVRVDAVPRRQVDRRPSHIVGVTADMRGQDPLNMVAARAPSDSRKRPANVRSPFLQLGRTIDDFGGCQEHHDRSYRSHERRGKSGQTCGGDDEGAG